MRGRLKGFRVHHLRILFDMMYSPSELAGELDIAVEQVYRVYIPLGCPHDRDFKNHILINGKVFVDWYRRNYR